MIYLSKGLLPWKPSGGGVSVSHCGLLHKLDDVRSELWLNGRFRPGQTTSKEQNAALAHLAELGIVTANDGAEESSIFRLLTNCSICQTRVRRRFVPLNRFERRIWHWLTRAGLRLTMAELTYLNEQNIKPVFALLGEGNRQALTEAIYTQETIFDGILEVKMEQAPARDDAVRAVLGLLRKRKIYLL